MLCSSHEEEIDYNLIFETHMICLELLLEFGSTPWINPPNTTRNDIVSTVKKP
jgi:hypothetical protein